MAAHDVQTKTCKVCAEAKPRIAVGTYTKKTSRRWVGLCGKQWNGLVCPDCQRNRALVNMRNLREERRGVKGE